MQALADGVLVRVELEKPKGRANHYLKIDEDVLNANRKDGYAI